MVSPVAIMIAVNMLAVAFNFPLCEDGEERGFCNLNENQENILRKYDHALWYAGWSAKVSFVSQSDNWDALIYSLICMFPYVILTVLIALLMYLEK